MIFTVIPVYNEEMTIGRTLSDLLKLDLFNKDNIVVVDDGSEDNSVKEVKKVGVVVLRHKINRGQGAALQTGHEYALKKKAQYIIDFDGDDQFNAKDIQKSLDVIREKKLDIVFGSRYLDSRSTLPWTKKNIIHPISKIINRIITGVKLTDAHNGFRIISAESAKEILIEQDRMAHNTEIVKKTKQLGLKYDEVPVEVKYHRYGQGISGGFEVIKDLILKT